MNLPDFDDVSEAAERIRGEAVRTPLVYARAASEALGRPVYVKPECLQRTGAFKFRGAYNRISQISPGEAPGGVVAVSSGNHAQGVAAAAAIMGLSAKIVMPADAPAAKIEGTLALGAEIAWFDRDKDNREAMAADIARKENRIFISPFDDVDVIAGQWTVGLEITEDADAAGLDVAAVLAPVGGGGLIAGVGLAVGARLPGAKIYGVEPEGFDDTRRSLAAGERVTNNRQTGSICDSLLTPLPGELTFALNRKQLAGVLTVSDDEAGQAVAHCYHNLKLVVEPGGAAAMAAVLQGRVPAGDGAIIAVLSGGNVDAGMFAELINAKSSVAD
ncbi:MAG: threonine/serine dehydratase [Hyphomicrobiales bacterium]